MREAKDINVLVGCEESQAVCIAFRELGFNAFSCDTQDCSGGHPEWHIKTDVRGILASGWDAGIFFPPCTYLCFAGIRWNTNNPEREKKTEDAIEFVKNIMMANIPFIALENPVGVIPRRAGIKWSQMVHPWEYGHEQEKKTCLWLKGFPLLIPTKIMEKREQKIFRKSALAGPGSSKDRSKNRSKTFPGIAKAMASQWGEYLLNQPDQA